MATVFDIETNGLLFEVTTIHCLVLKDTETATVFRFHGESLDFGIRLLMANAKDGLIVGHNVIRFDLPVIQKIYPWFQVPEANVVDTLVLSRLIFSNLRDRDGGHVEAGKLPPKLSGSHSLEAWGYRLGLMKGEYSAAFKERLGDAYVPGMEWLEFSQDMLDYCVQDVEVSEAFYRHLTSSTYSPKATQLEHEVAWICARMERSGWPFDVRSAAGLYATLAQRRDTIRQDMLEIFPPIVTERWSEKTGKRLKDGVEEFNPGSRDQIAKRLTAKYGWKPKLFTDGGRPKIDEDVLGSLDFPEAKVLAEYFLLEKRIGQLAEGDTAWLKSERAGHIHGSVNTNGAATGRCTHASPNIAQVPSVRALWGKECRQLFGVRKGFRMVGCDLSGLELRCLASFMARWDAGEYVRTLLTGDVHTTNQLAAGLPTRDDAKRFIYAFLYGAGDELIGDIVGGGRAAGKKIKAKFLAGLPALNKLKEKVEKVVKERGYLIGLDGRHVHIRSPHSALNFLLQGAGALISKRWLVEVWIEVMQRGYRYGWNGDFVLLGYIHDELQFAVREELADSFGQMVTECARRAGEFFEFKCPIDAEYKTGLNWYDTH